MCIYCSASNRAAALRDPGVRASELHGPAGRFYNYLQTQGIFVTRVRWEQDSHTKVTILSHFCPDTRTDSGKTVGAVERGFSVWGRAPGI